MLALSPHLFASVLLPFYYQKRGVIMPYTQYTQSAESALNSSLLQTEPEEKLKHLERALRELIEAVRRLEREQP